MRLEGLSTETICEQAEIKPRTLYVWFSDPLVKAELVERQRRINELFAERLALVASSALDELETLVKAPTQGAVTPETKLKAVKEVLDRTAATPDPCRELRRNLQSMSDEELRDSARWLLSGAEQAT